MFLFLFLFLVKILLWFFLFLLLVTVCLFLLFLDIGLEVTIHTIPHTILSWPLLLNDFILLIILLYLSTHKLPDQRIIYFDIGGFYLETILIHGSFVIGYFGLVSSYKGLKSVDWLFYLVVQSFVFLYFSLLVVFYRRS